MQWHVYNCLYESAQKENIIVFICIHYKFDEKCVTVDDPNLNTMHENLIEAAVEVDTRKQLKVVNGDGHNKQIKGKSKKKWRKVDLATRTMIS